MSEIMREKKTIGFYYEWIMREWFILKFEVGSLEFLRKVHEH